MNLIDFEYNGELLSEHECIIGYVSDDNSSNISLGNNLKLNTVKNMDMSLLINSEYPDVIQKTFTIVKNPCGNLDNSIFSEPEVESIMKWLNRKEYHKFKPIYSNDEYTDTYFIGTFTRVEGVLIGGEICGFTLTLETNAPYGFVDFNYKNSKLNNKEDWELITEYKPYNSGSRICRPNNIITIKNNVFSCYTKGRISFDIYKLENYKWEEFCSLNFNNDDNIESITGTLFSLNGELYCHLVIKKINDNTRYIYFYKCEKNTMTLINEVDFNNNHGYDIEKVLIAPNSTSILVFSYTNIFMWNSINDNSFTIFKIPYDIVERLPNYTAPSFVDACIYYGRIYLLTHSYSQDHSSSLYGTYKSFQSIGIVNFSEDTIAWETSVVPEGLNDKHNCDAFHYYIYDSDLYLADGINNNRGNDVDIKHDIYYPNGVFYFLNYNYKWENNRWDETFELPLGDTKDSVYDVQSRQYFMYNSQLHVLTGFELYKYNDKRDWELLCDYITVAPNEFNGIQNPYFPRPINIISYNNNVYGATSFRDINKTFLYKLNSTNTLWEKVCALDEVGLLALFIYQSKLCALFGKNIDKDSEFDIYAYNNTTNTFSLIDYKEIARSDVAPISPSNFKSIIVFNDTIYLANYSTGLYQWDDLSLLGNLRYRDIVQPDTSYNCAFKDCCVYNNRIYLLCNGYNEDRGSSLYGTYKWFSAIGHFVNNNIVWETITLPDYLYENPSINNGLFYYTYNNNLYLSGGTKQGFDFSNLNYIWNEDENKWDTSFETPKGRTNGVYSASCRYYFELNNKLYLHTSGSVSEPEEHIASLHKYNPKEKPEVDLNDIFNIYNNSQELGYIYPNIIKLKCSKDGDVSIINSLEPSRITVISNCKKGEIITINCKNKMIESSLFHNNLYNCFNYIYPRLVTDYTEELNTFEVTNAKILEFNYSAVRKVGVMI